MAVVVIIDRQTTKFSGYTVATITDSCQSQNKKNLTLIDVRRIASYVLFLRICGGMVNHFAMNAMNAMNVLIMNDTWWRPTLKI